ncbi:hypothetical protein Tco_1282923 [Tanacetum coccineum]
MLFCKKEEAGIQLIADEVDWRDETDEKPDDQELEAHYAYMAKIQEVIPEAVDNSGPIFDTEPFEQVHSNENYNVFTNERQYPEQPGSINDTYVMEQDDSNITFDSSDMCTDEVNVDHETPSDEERALLASLIDELKREIDANKMMNKQLKQANTSLTNEVTRYRQADYVKEADLKIAKANGLAYEQKVISDIVLRLHFKFIT